MAGSFDKHILVRPAGLPVEAVGLKGTGSPMLVTGYRKDIFRPECNPRFQSLHSIAHFDEDISKVLPYLSAALGGHQYLREPPALTLKSHGKLITMHPRELAINALKDEEEVDRVLEWLNGEINTTWEKRGEIRLSFETPARP